MYKQDANMSIHSIVLLLLFRYSCSNYLGHVWLDGSGGGCAVPHIGIQRWTQNGSEKQMADSLTIMLTGGDTYTQIYTADYRQCDHSHCMLPTPDHMHEAGEPAGEDGAMTSRSDGSLMGLEPDGHVNPFEDHHGAGADQRFYHPCPECDDIYFFGGGGGGSQV
jgi:hypothetical protein